MKQLIPYLVPLILGSGILILGCHRLETKVQIYIFQSFLLSLLGVAMGSVTHNFHAFWMIALIFLGKCVLIPAILMMVIKKVQMKREVESYVSLPTSMMIGGLLILLSYHLLPSLPLGHGEVFDHVLKVGIALVLIGLFIMISRKKAFTQILGLYVMDNGIFCLTIAIVFEMPLIIEMGIVFELLLGALVMGILVYRIKQSFDTVNVAHLKNLRG